MMDVGCRTKDIGYRTYDVGYRRVLGLPVRGGKSTKGDLLFRNIEVMSPRESGGVATVQVGCLSKSIKS